MFEIIEPTENLTFSPWFRPDLDFMAPEDGLDRDSGLKLSGATDMFSLGMVAFALYNTKPLFTNSGSWNRSSH